MYMKYERSKPPTLVPGLTPGQETGARDPVDLPGAGVVPVHHPVAAGKGVARPKLADDPVPERLQQIREAAGRGVQVAADANVSVGPRRRLRAYRPGTRRIAATAPSATTTSALHMSR